MARMVEEKGKGADFFMSVGGVLKLAVGVPVQRRLLLEGFTG